MLFSSLLVSLFAGVAAVNFQPSGDVPAGSRLGQSLLNKAAVVHPARHLENGERDVTFISGYSLRYLGCSSLIQINPEEGGGEEGALYTQHLVRFALCPSDNCKSCSGGGEYVVSMNEFVDLYTESKLQETEYKCEMIRETCYCDNANDDEACENQCYARAGMKECIQYEGEEEFEIQRYLECQEMEGGNQNNNNQNANYGNYNNNNNGAYYGQAFIGPYCSPKDGKSIFLGVFYDQGCTAKADDSIYAKAHYGMALPFSTESIVSTSDCISCEQQEEQNYQQQYYNGQNGGNYNNGNGNGNNQMQNYNYNANGNNGYYYENNVEVTELCERSYEMAARCESKMDIMYKDTSGCEYINSILPRLEAASRSIGIGITGGARVATAFAFIFAFIAIVFGAYAYFLYRKIKRGTVDLASS